ncbi:MAG: cytochrome c oxidase assembly protein subunit 11 [Cocleimonas sp.]|jgi:cytochrome c oxidase assembly protein subunit 11
MNNRNSNISKTFWAKLFITPVLFFAFAFAMVPLYDIFCEITGLNGKTSSATYAAETRTIDTSRKVTVDFTSFSNPGFPVKFYPMVKKLEVIPGKLYTMTYYAENRSDTKIVGQAIPSVAPGLAASYFKKLECFCFNQQTFEPKVPIEMPVRFFVDSDLDKNIKNITLSYNFLKVKNVTKEVAKL